jgi:hypothetical protein
MKLRTVTLEPVEITALLWAVDQLTAEALQEVCWQGARMPAALRSAACLQANL